MPVVLLEKDPFVKVLNEQSNQSLGTDQDVRRPLEGLAGKNVRHAFLSVYHSSGQALSLIDSSAGTTMDGQGYSPATHNFLLTSVTHQIQEKSQVIETFGDFHIFFYGQKPQFLQCSGLLMNARNFNWKNEWIRNYNRYLRGTKCVENRARAYLGFDDVLVSGYIMATGTSYNSENPNACPFNFTFVVTGYRDLSEYNTDYANEIRNYVSDSGVSSEHVTQGFSGTAFQYVDPETGAVESTSGMSGGAAATSTDPRTAPWVGDGQQEAVWMDSADALVEIDTELARQQSGSDRTTVRRSLRSDSSQFPLSTRSGNSSDLGVALSSGVSNGAFVIGDHPTVS